MVSVPKLPCSSAEPPVRFALWLPKATALTASASPHGAVAVARTPFCAVALTVLPSLRPPIALLITKVATITSPLFQEGPQGSSSRAMSVVSVVESLLISASDVSLRSHNIRRRKRARKCTPRPPSRRPYVTYFGRQGLAARSGGHTNTSQRSLALSL